MVTSPPDSLLQKGYRDLLFQRPDGSQVLVTVWDDNCPTMAERPDKTATWGPPLDARDDRRVPG